ncbi:MAG: WD40/YVTN/BNR-like repeat-containing protein [bacterium]
MVKKLLVLIMSLPLVIFAAEWQSLNGPPAGRADDMSIGCYEGVWVIYAADQTHKLYKSTNGGEHWDSIYTYEEVVNPVCVITDPNYARVVYIGKNDATPVWKSEDGGQTWEPKSYGITNTRPLCFAMDPFDSRIIYLGCKKDKDRPVLFRTTNGGFYWEELNISGYDINDILTFFFADEGIILILATEKGILRGRPYDDFKLVKEGEFKQLCYDKKAGKIFAKGIDRVWQSSDGKWWEIYQSAKPVDFSGLSDIIKRRQ